MILAVAGSNLIKLAAVLEVVADVLRSFALLIEKIFWIVLGIAIIARLLIVDKPFPLKEILLASLLIVIGGVLGVIYCLVSVVLDVDLTVGQIFLITDDILL